METASRGRRHSEVRQKSRRWEENPAVDVEAGKTRRELVQERCAEMSGKQGKEGRRGFSWARATVISISHYISRSLSPTYPPRSCALHRELISM